MSAALTGLTKKQLSAELIASQPIRSLTNEQRSKIHSILKQYWIHLGTAPQRLGSINLSIGFTHSLINSVVKNCEYRLTLWIMGYWPLTFGMFHMLTLLYE